MRINVWGINYAPELTGIGVYSAGLCEFLAQAGDDVSAVTAFPYYPSWRKLDSDRMVLYRTDRLNGVTVHRCWHYVPARPSTFSRILHEASFVFNSALRQLTLPAPDVYVVVSPPLALGVAAWLVSLVMRRPFVFHVQDLQPDAAIGLGMLKGGLLLRFLYWLEHCAYEKAAKVTVISEQMKAAIKDKGIADDKVSVFPNWVEIPAPDGIPERGLWRARCQIGEGAPLVSYVGNLGVKQGLSVVIEAARLLEGKHDARFVIAGDGAERDALEQMVRDFQISNVSFEGVLPEAEHSQLLVDSDICLVTQRQGSGVSFLPSKLLKILALGRPVVTNATRESALSHSVAEGGFGLCVPPGSPDALAQAVVELLADEPKRKRMSGQGRRYVERFAANSVLKSFRQLLLEIVERKP